MDDSHTLEHWRELLDKIVKDPRERNILAGRLRVNPVTLTRWVSGESTPRSYNLKALLKALPEQREAFLDILPAELLSMPLRAKEPGDDFGTEIPIAFYRRVLRDNAVLAESLHNDSLCNLILQQALQQFDPERIGMEITIARCMPPDEHAKIRSLREDTGLGTASWQRDLHQRTMFLGSESLAGFVVRTGMPRPIQNHEEGKNFFPAHWVEGEESAMACPIMHMNLIAGCFLISCSVPNCFIAQERQALAQDYADLLTVAFAHNDFYDIGMIDLLRMPSYEAQRPYISKFRHQVSEHMKHSIQTGQYVSVSQAEQEIWRQIEQKLFTVD